MRTTSAVCCATSGSQSEPSARFAARIRELIESRPDLIDIIQPLRQARRTLREPFATLHRQLRALVRQDAVCRRLMTVPGGGPGVSLAFVATVDTPARFRRSKAVGPALGLTPVLDQSGESSRGGRISWCGAAMMRTLRFEAAQLILPRASRWSWLKAWALKVAQRAGKGWHRARPSAGDHSASDLV